ncbi:hypothetical protein FB451DRAFT_1416562 [Mycena latifolia]|nr:hypothetical protein FB451DRAFT_1416562 [Mycena latifolia]
MRPWQRASGGAFYLVSSDFHLAALLVHSIHTAKTPSHPGIDMAKRWCEIHFTADSAQPAPSESQPAVSKPVAEPSEVRVCVERFKQHDVGPGTPHGLSTSQPSQPSTSQSTSAVGHTKMHHILREKTRIVVDGSIKQQQSVVEVAASVEEPTPRLCPDVLRARERVYDLYEDADNAVGDDVNDGGHDLRDSDDPFRQWAVDHLEHFLAEFLCLEGWGDHGSICAVCLEKAGDHRCAECLGGGEMLCSGCILEMHRRLPFHQIQHWTGSIFVRKTLKEMGLHIQLGHWHSADRR